MAVNKWTMNNSCGIHIDVQLDVITFASAVDLNMQISN